MSDEVRPSEWDDISTWTYKELCAEASKVEKRLLDVGAYAERRALINLRIDASYIIGEFVRRGSTRSTS